MLTKYREIPVKEELPYPFNMLTIDTQSRISISNSNLAKLASKDGYPRVFSVRYRDAIMFIREAVLINAVTKNLTLPTKYWFKLDVLYLDGDPNNVSPANLVWRYPDSGICLPELTGYRSIPGLSRYLINETGTVFSIPAQRTLSTYVGKVGYSMVGMQPDVGGRRVFPIHRLLALTYIPYEPTVDKLDVNHKNGIKLDNSLGNLEWATRAENCIHAYSTGLRNDNISVLVRDCQTDEVVEYFSLSEAAKRLNVNAETVNNRCKAGCKKVWPPGLQFKFKSDNTPWPRHINAQQDMNRSGLARELKVTGPDGAIIAEFASIASAARLVGVSRYVLSKMLENGSGSCNINGILVNDMWR